MELPHALFAAVLVFILVSGPSWAWVVSKLAAATAISRRTAHTPNYSAGQREVTPPNGPHPPITFVRIAFVVLISGRLMLPRLAQFHKLKKLALIFLK